MKNHLILLLIFYANNVCFSQSFSSLSVFVTDEETSMPVANASIIVKEVGWMSKTTGSDGTAFFDKSMPIGEINYIVSKEGYQGKEGQFNITTEEKSNTLNIKISKFRDDRLLIIGEVVDENNNDLEGAIVEVKFNEIIKNTTTDASGNYRIELLLNSIYNKNSLKIEAKCKNGTSKQTETIDLTRNNTINKDFKLTCSVVKQPADKNFPSQTIYGIKVSLEKCELLGNKLICHLIYENVSNSPELRINLEGRSNRLTDENGLVYKSEMQIIGNVESRGGTHGYNLPKGIKVKGQVEFLITNTNIKNISLFETGMEDKFKFYQINISKD